MAPPSIVELQKIVDKKYKHDEIQGLLADYVKKDDQEMLFNFLLGAPITLDQLKAIIHGTYEIKKTAKEDGGYSMAINFDLSEVNTHKLDSKLPRSLIEFILNKDETDLAKKRRILTNLIPEKHMDNVLKQISEGNIDSSSLDSIMNGHYTVGNDGIMKIAQKLDVDLLHIDDNQLRSMLDGHYTCNQLCRLLKFKFTPLEIRAIFDSGLTPSQLKGVLKGNYEVSRKKMEDGSGYVIELVYGKESYKDYLQAILDGKYPLDQVLKLFKGRLSPEELTELLKMNLKVPDLHALIIGDYVIQRMENPDGSYSLNVVYNPGAGDVKEIEEIDGGDNTGKKDGDPISSPAKDTSKDKPSTTVPAKSTIDPAKSTIDPAKSTIDPAKSTIDPAKSTIDSPKSTIDPAKSKIDPAKSTIDPAKSTIDPAKSTIDPAKSTIDPPKSTIDPPKSTIDPAKSTIDPLLNIKQDQSKAKPKEEPIVPPGEVKRRLLEAEEAVKAVGQAVEKENNEPIQKVKIPDLTNDKEWNIEKGNKLKIPSIFSSAVKSNFFKKEVKHLEKDKIKTFYETKGQKQK